MIVNTTNASKHIRLWCNEEIKEQIQQDKILKCIQQEVHSQISCEWDENAYLIELHLKKKPASNYAKLGLKYTKTEEDSLHVKVFIGSDEGPIIKDTIVANDEVYAGIPKEYGEEILRTATYFLDANGCPTGELTFHIGAHGYYGSSSSIFKEVTIILLNLIACKCRSIDDCKSAIMDIMNNLQ